jgi:hypothetical protein
MLPPPPPKITLISPSAHLRHNLPDDDHLVGVPTTLVLLGVASSSDPGKFCNPPDRAMRCSESHTTSLRHQDVKNVSSLSAPRIAYRGIHGLLGPYDRPNQLC